MSDGEIKQAIYGKMICTYYGMICPQDYTLVQRFYNKKMITNNESNSKCQRKKSLSDMLRYVTRFQNLHTRQDHLLKTRPVHLRVCLRLANEKPYNP